MCTFGVLRAVVCEPKNENCGGRREKKKSEILGGPAEGYSRRVVQRRGFTRRVQRKGPSEMGCRVRGFELNSGFWVTKTETEQKQNEERNEK